MVLVADTSALVSLAIADDGGLVDILFEEYDVRVPPAVVNELQTTAAYDDAHATAATRGLDHVEERHIHQLASRPEYPLDAGKPQLSG